VADSGVEVAVGGLWERVVARKRQKRVYAITSGGGHWQQLMWLRPAFKRQHVLYIRSDAAHAVDAPGSDLLIVTDVNRDRSVRLSQGASKMFLRVMMTDPDVFTSARSATSIGGRCDTFRNAS
jgi:hypothetical protein